MKRIEAALNVQLIDNANSVKIVYQNQKYTAVEGTPYQQPFFLPATPDPWIIGSATNFHTGFYQINLMYPAGEGQADINVHADVLIAAFNQATTLTYSSIDTIIKSSGRGNASQQDGWYFMPVQIRWECYLPN